VKIPGSTHCCNPDKIRKPAKTPAVTARKRAGRRGVKDDGKPEDLPEGVYLISGNGDRDNFSSENCVYFLHIDFLEEAL